MIRLIDGSIDELILIALARNRLPYEIDGLMESEEKSDEKDSNID